VAVGEVTGATDDGRLKLGGRLNLRPVERVALPGLGQADRILVGVEV
jgi:hypothetical protein